MSDLDGCLLARFAGREPPDWLRRWLDDAGGRMSSELDAIIERGRDWPLVVAVRDAHRLPRGAGRANLEAAADVLLGGIGYPPDGAGHDAPEVSP